MKLVKKIKNLLNKWNYVKEVQLWYLCIFGGDNMEKNNDIDFNYKMNFILWIKV